MRINARLLFLAVVVFSGPAISQAQVSTGTPPFGSFGGGPDIVNLGNLNVHVTIPVRHKAGRGTNFDYDLTYDSSIWYPVSGAWKLVSSPTLPGWAGLALAGEAYIGYSLQYSSGQCTPNGSTFYWYYVWDYVGFFYYDQVGVRHNFPGGFAYIQNNSGGSCGPPPGYQPNSNQQANLSTDGSGYTLYLTPVPNGGAVTPYLIDSHGSNIKPPVISNPTQYWGSMASTDRNGNQITSSNGSYTDTLGQNPLNVVGTAPSNTNLSYTAPSGGTATFVVSYKSYTVKTNFGCGGIAEYGPTSNSLVDRITLPDGSYYQFGYETTYQDTHSPHYVTGRIASVQLPTGGTISYQYATGGTGVNGIWCSDGAATTLVRTTSPGGPWTYVRTQISGNHWQKKGTTPPDPTVGDDTVIDFQKDSTTPPSGDQNTNNFYETQRLAYQGSSSSGTLFQTITTCYNGNTSSCPTTSVGSPITQRNLTAQFGSAGLQNLQIFKYNGYGLPTEEDDYDYASGTPTTVLRQTLTSYASLGNGIAGMPASVTVKDGSGSIKAQTTYSYDQGTPSPSPNTPQHVSITGSRGNATTVSSLVGGSSALSQTFSYYDTGMVNVATDVNNGTTTYSYAGTSCGNAFPTQITEAVGGMTKSFSWNCTGAVVTSVTDENGKATTYAYANDPYYWRPDSKTDPTGATLNFCYGVQSGGTCSRNVNQVESYMNFNGSSSTVDVLSTVDGLGRQILQQTRQGPSSSNFDTIETDYDTLGRVSRVTLPFKAAAGVTSSTAPGTSTKYDVLNRFHQITDSGNGSTTYTYTNNDALVSVSAPSGENPKNRQFEYNGLGELISVCEVTTLSGNGSCAQNNPQNGYLTKYTYDPLGDLLSVTQNAQASSGYQQSRSYTYDGLGRLTSEGNPESGTKTYTYDTDSTCAVTSHGDLIKKIDALGNVTCISYDALHRQTAITYPSGPYASATRNRYFVYDGATVNGSTMDYAKARLAEAYTSTSQNGTKTTDLGFGYTVRGELSKVYEATPNSAGYYFAQQTYFANGTPYQLSNITGLPAFTNNVEGEGRISSVSASSGQNPVTSVNYNAYGAPPQLTVNFGSGDSDVFSYDANTLRQTKYQFKVNSQSYTGTLGWNANGTLATLSIADPFNSADTQSCTFAYDDLIRLTGSNCGAVATDTYSYDAFGNIAKSGTFNLAALYTNPQTGQNTNRYISIGGTSVSYDANGNVLKDPSHTYTWDSEGRVASVDGISITYDAVGRRVEIGYPSEILFLPDGSTVLFKGQVAQRGFFNLPGGAQALYDSTQGGLIQYTHPDHLGSHRLISTPSRTFSSSLAYAPFGEQYAQSVANGGDFTGQPESFAFDEYEFPARIYSTQGRWTAPDPAGLAAVDPTNPQSWNRYAYVKNNPLASVDPTGLDGCNVFNVSWEGSGMPFPCGDASIHTSQPAESANSVSGPIGVAVGSMIGNNADTPSPEGFPPGAPFGPPQRIGVPIFTGLYNPDGTPIMDTWYGSGGPIGLANVPSIVGTQIGDDLKTVPQWYFEEVKGNTTTVLNTPFANTTGTLTISQQGVWGLISSVFGLQDYASMSFPNLNLANQTSGSCATAGQKITQFIAQNPGKPIPPSLTQAMGPACSGL